MKYMMRIPKKLAASEVREYFFSVGLADVVDAAVTSSSESDGIVGGSPIPPNLIDLYRLHQFIKLNKRLNVLEFGCGWSTLVMAHALDENRKRYAEDVKFIRCDDPFALAVVDNEKKYLGIAEQYVNNAGLSNVGFNYSLARMATFNNRLTTQYDQLPLVNPDFIYLDGPSQYSVVGSINGLTTSHKDFMPMSSDILLFEHFLAPSTIVVVDGRTANARFMLCNLQRNWSYSYDEWADQHIFHLVENSLGKYDLRKIEFYTQ